MKKIRKIIGIALITILGVSIIGCDSSSSSSGNSSAEETSSKWQQVNSMEITHKTYIGGFLNENYGITVGYAGEVHYTTDGGKTWPQGKNTSYCRFGMDIVNENVAYNCGNGAHVRKTIDGGKTWTEVKNYGKSEPHQCRYMRFIDEKTGWIASLEELGYTNDAGISWVDINKPKDIGQILAIDLLDSNTGYVIDGNKMLYITKDNGKTFESKKIPLNDLDTLVYSTNQMALKFTNENDGELFYYGEDGKLKDYVTSDGGTSWKEEKIEDIEEYGPLYISNDGKYLTINGDNCTKLIVMKKN